MVGPTSPSQTSSQQSLKEAEANQARQPNNSKYSVMVKFTKRGKDGSTVVQPQAAIAGAAAVLVLLVVALNAFKEPTPVTSTMLLATADSKTPPSMRETRSLPLESIDFTSNSQKVKEWRKTIRDQCSVAQDPDTVNLLPAFALPESIPQQPREGFRRCKNIVMDFGANIGDTSGKVIDAGLINCGKDHKNAATFNIETKQFETVKQRNRLVKHLEQLMVETAKVKGEEIGPEDYCYYGVEGNPVFTERLRAIEDFVMAIRPRPIQHLHFLTESVGAGKDGPTKLYLDTVNTEQNFWGSSIFEQHQDVKKSAAAGNQKAADVTGYTIGTLMKETLSYFEDGVADNHFILKVDIEGGEYPLLHQAADEGTLCKFAEQKGNTADLFIEFHSARVTGKHDYMGQTKALKEKLTACGVNFRNLAAWWA